MPFYSDDIVEQVLTSNDIVDVVGSYVQIKKKGSTYFGLCPFHNEKTPSFSVDERKQMYYCFGCHKGGSAITFMMEMESFTFGEAMEYLAERGGVNLPKYTPRAGAEQQKHIRDNLFGILEEAADYYHKKLLSPEGERGLSYLKGRGLSDETIDKFHLGFATAKGGLYEHLKNLGYDDDSLVKSGLVSFNEKDGFKDKFWNRVMFPIQDQGGRKPHVIAFGGRVMGDGEPKYLNSPETEIFNKRKNLFALSLARRSRQKGLILCEGYMDVISLHQAGFDNAVAALGTAFTEEHAAMLPRFADGLIYLCFDSDGAGRDAIIRAIPMIEGAGLTAKVIRMNPYKDPDEFIKNESPEVFKERIARADNSFLFEMEYLSERYDRTDPTELTKFQTALCTEIVKRFREPLTRENYISSVSEKFSIDRELLRQRVNSMGELAPARKEAHRELPTSSGRRAAEEKKQKTFDERQTLLLHYLAEYPVLYPQIKDILTVVDFDPPLLRRAAELLFGQLEAGPPGAAKVVPEAIMREFNDPEEAGLIAGIFYRTFSNEIPQDNAKERPEEISRGIAELIISIKKESLKKNTNEGSSFAQKIEEKKMLESISKRTFTIV